MSTRKRRGGRAKPYAVRTRGPLATDVWSRPLRRRSEEGARTLMGQVRARVYDDVRVRLTGPEGVVLGSAMGTKTRPVG